MIADISNYRPTAEDKFFFDTNIWFIVGDFDGMKQGKRKYAKLYLQALKSIQSSGAVVYTNDWIISEIINGYSRLKHSRFNKYWKKRLTFKEYRASDSFLEVTEVIEKATGEILSRCQFIGSSIKSTDDLKRLIAEYSAGRYDFNDQVIAETCKANNLILVTHDSDFSDAGIPILTANTSLLSKR